MKKIEADLFTNLLLLPRSPTPSSQPWQASPCRRLGSMAQESRTRRSKDGQPPVGKRARKGLTCYIYIYICFLSLMLYIYTPHYMGVPFLRHIPTHKVANPGVGCLSAKRIQVAQVDAWGKCDPPPIGKTCSDDHPKWQVTTLRICSSIGHIMLTVHLLVLSTTSLQDRSTQEACFPSLCGSPFAVRCATFQIGWSSGVELAVISALLATCFDAAVFRSHLHCTFARGRVLVRVWPSKPATPPFQGLGLV